MADTGRATTGYTVVLPPAWRRIPVRRAVTIDGAMGMRTAPSGTLRCDHVHSPVDSNVTSMIAPEWGFG